MILGLNVYHGDSSGVALGPGGPAGLHVEAKREVCARFERGPARMATRVWALFVLDEWRRRHLG